MSKTMVSAYRIALSLFFMGTSEISLAQRVTLENVELTGDCAGSKFQVEPQAEFDELVIYFNDSMSTESEEKSAFLSKHCEVTYTLTPGPGQQLNQFSFYTSGSYTVDSGRVSTRSSHQVGDLEPLVSIDSYRGDSFPTPSPSTRVFHKKNLDVAVSTLSESYQSCGSPIPFKSVLTVKTHPARLGDYTAKIKLGEGSLGRFVLCSVH
ncbi:MAG: hypothetical protein KA436_06845 [Oligoflexales bacterium]|nr:hypothetical protein [Oligoflexales bacterium]